MGRLGTRDDMVVYQQYVTDLLDSVKQALATVDRSGHTPRHQPVHRQRQPWEDQRCGAGAVRSRSWWRPAMPSFG